MGRLQLALALALVLAFVSWPATTPSGGGTSQGLDFCYSRPSAAVNKVTNSSFAVWYGSSPGAKEKAKSLLSQLTSGIKPKFSFMKPPVPDTDACEDGGTAVIDFYLIPDVRMFFWDPNSNGSAYVLKTGVPDSYSGFVEIDEDLKGLKLSCVAAHEYFHLLQVRYGKAKNDRWWYEGTATWAEHLYNNDCPEPPLHAANFLHHSSELNITELKNPYVSPRFVRKVFEGIGTGQAPAEAIGDQVWKIVFPDFVLHEFNKGTVDDFKKWKATDESVEVKPHEASLNGKPKKESTIDITVQPGAGYHVLVQALDVDTRNLEIDVSDFTGHVGQGAALRVLMQPTEPVGINTTDYEGYCRAAPGRPCAVYSGVLPGFSRWNMAVTMQFTLAQVKNRQ